ncbi:MAG: hypothetical protein U1F48_01350 [Burkholderiales bacterium]
MQKHCAKAAVAACLVAFATSAAAVDFAYFQSQTCEELQKEFTQLKKAEAAAADAVKKENDRAARDKGLAVASAFLLGFGWWSEADHSNTNQIQAEIRDDLRMVTRAASQKKCALPEK